jgi:DNA topoisomerase-1
LYELVWKRAVASQMQSAELDQVAVDVASGGTRLRANGSIVAFDGYLKLYREDVDDAPEAQADESRMLPPMHERDPVDRERVNADQHFTQPPPRYSEASLVKKMEELGIGRPSTYASILTVLRDREYVRMESRRFVPEDRGRLVTAFLTSFFERYVDTGFTAALEEQLDDISGGRAEWRAVMQAFWEQFSLAVEQTRELKISDVIDALDHDLGEHFFPAPADGSDPRLCPACHAGRLGLKLGRHGSFIGCSNYPGCQYTRRLAIESGDQAGETLKEGMRELGHHPVTGETITVRRGPYGLYVQQGEPNPEDKKSKPRRTSLPKGVDGESITIEQAIGLLSLPRLVGVHPERGEPIEAGIGRFGPFVRMGGVYASLDKDDDVVSVGINRAVDALAKKLDSVRSLGPHPKDKQPVMIKKGRFGPYAQHGTTVANLPKDVGIDDMSLDAAVALLAERGKVLKGKGRGKAAAKKATTKAAPAPAAKAAPAKKAAPKKPAKRAAGTKAPAQSPARKAG